MEEIRRWWREPPVGATREATVTKGSDSLPTIIGTPQAGETVDGRTFDGHTEIAWFPGDLPDDPESIFEGGSGAAAVGAGRDARARAAPAPHVLAGKQATCRQRPPQSGLHG